MKKYLYFSFLLILLSLFLGPLAPLGTKGFFLSRFDLESWEIARLGLSDVAKETIILMMGTAFFSLVFGLTQALLLGTTNFPFKKIFSVLLTLPLASPLYVYAMIFVGSLEYSAPLPTFFRESLGLNLGSLFQVKTPLFASLVFAFALTPYLFMMAKTYFERFELAKIWVARNMGLKDSFFILRLLIPSALPILFSGLTIIMMETIADFGAVSVFNVNTLTTEIYQAWFGLFSLGAATRIALILIIVSFTLLFIERRVERSSALTNLSPVRNENLFTLSKLQITLGMIFLIGYILITLLLPLIQLLIWAIEGLDKEPIADFLSVTIKTLGLGLFSATTIFIVANILSFAKIDLARSRHFSSNTKLLLFGYGLPGTLIAVAVYQFINLFFPSSSLTPTLSLCALSFGLTIRFLSVAFRPIDSATLQVPESLIMTTFAIKLNLIKRIKHLYLPYTRQVLFWSLGVAFIEVIKEMPMTLILRPFGFSTYSVRIYELTSEGEWERASVYALSLLLLSGTFLIMGQLRMKKRISNES